MTVLDSTTLYHGFTTLATIAIFDSTESIYIPHTMTLPNSSYTLLNQFLQNSTLFNWILLALAIFHITKTLCDSIEQTYSMHPTVRSTTLLQPDSTVACFTPLHEAPQ